MATKNTQNMDLVVWTSGDDVFNWQDIANNFDKIDAHNHVNNPINSTGIAPGAIDTAQLASGAVTADKIDSGAITGVLIGNNSIGNSQLDLTNVNEARTTLPTGTIEDGYTFDYTDANLSFVWRLRYVNKVGFNGGQPTWVFVGGTGILGQTTTDTAATASTDTSYVWYGNPGRAVNYVDIPLPGTYLVEHKLIWQPSTTNAQGIFSSGLSIGAIPTTETNTTTDYTDSRTYGIYNKSLNSFHELSSTASKIVVNPNQTLSNRKLRQSIRIDSCSTGTSVTGTIYFASLLVTPLTISGNWS